MEQLMGKKAKDIITGFKGVVVARAEYMYGCVQFQIEGTDHNGSPKSWWFDEPRVVAIQERKTTPVKQKTHVRHFGPKDTPPSRSHPNFGSSDHSGMTGEGDE